MEGLERYLGLHVILDDYSREIVAGTTTPLKSIDTIINKTLALKSDFESLLSTNDSYVIPEEKLFKEMFAHRYCYLIVEGIESLLAHLGFEAQVLILIDEKGEDAHYLIEFNHNNQNWFVDAYGLFDSLDTIKARYPSNTIVKSHIFDPQDDSDAFYDRYKDCGCDLFDTLQGHSETHHNNDTTEDICDYHDLFLHHAAFDIFSKLPFKTA